MAARCLFLLAAATTLAAVAPHHHHHHHHHHHQHHLERRGLDSDWHVLTNAGAVGGDILSGPDNITYFSFKGIPYAEPPLGELRFKNPRPVRPWDGVRPALAEGAKCTQVALPSGRVEGGEDCLFLNVYTRWLGPARLPVMVYIHGGGFSYGSGTAAENGPEFLVFQDVVLVTFNYRLGAFGFLNLDNDDVPGNMGLKDQRLVLQWVQENIHFFGGDANRVTIFGNSAGAASVHYHSICRASEGLFHAAIMQSGNALGSWAYQETHLAMAAKLAAQLGVDTASGAEQARAIRSASTADILQATVRLIQADPQLQLGFPAFGPSPERRAAGSEERFLTKDPESLVRRPEVSPVPTILGLSGNEGYFAYFFGSLSKQPDLVAAFKQNPGLLLPPNVAPYQDTRSLLGVNARVNLTAGQVAEYGRLLGVEYNLANDPENTGLIRFLGDLFTPLPSHRLVNLTLAGQGRGHGRGAPLFLYHFLEDGDYNWGKISLNITLPGATHTDELGYLMHITSPTDLRQSLGDDTPSSRTLGHLTKLWTNFAKSHNPELRGWVPVDPNTDVALTAPFAKLSQETLGGLGRGLGGKAMALWDKIFDTLRT